MRTCQVAYYDNDNNRWFGGILVNDEYIICGCCGGIVYLDELRPEDILYFEHWTDISNKIIEI